MVQIDVCVHLFSCGTYKIPNGYFVPKLSGTNYVINYDDEYCSYITNLSSETMVFQIKEKIKEIDDIEELCGNFIISLM